MRVLIKKTKLDVEITKYCDLMQTDETHIKKDQAKKNKQLERVNRLVRVLGREVLTRQGLMAGLGLKKQGIRNFRNNYWYPARDLQWVEMYKIKSPTSPEQAYKLTALGMEQLAKLEAQDVEHSHNGMGKAASA